MKNDLRFKIKRGGKFMVLNIKDIRDETDTILCFVNGCEQPATIKGEAILLPDDKQTLERIPAFLCEKHYKEIKKSLNKEGAID